jgi:prepilin-type N-terminal cleavage/methylation domain-containing protein
MHKRDGFTLIDVMMVVAIIALLASLAMPNFLKSRHNAQVTIFITQLTKLVGGFETYSIIEGGYPPDTTPGVLPDGMDAYFSKSSIWASTTPIGGYWDWDYNQTSFGARAGVSVYQPSLSDDEMEKIDVRIDDGNLYTGRFRKRHNGFISIIE